MTPTRWGHRPRSSHLAADVFGGAGGRRAGCATRRRGFEPASNAAQADDDVIEQTLDVWVDDRRLRFRHSAAHHDAVGRGRSSDLDGDERIVPGEVDGDLRISGVCSTEVAIAVIDVDDGDAIADIARESSWVLQIGAFQACLKDAAAPRRSREGL